MKRRRIQNEKILFCNVSDQNEIFYKFNKVNTFFSVLCMVSDNYVKLLNLFSFK